MRAVLLFLLLLILAVIGYFAAVKVGWLPEYGAEQDTIEEPAPEREPEIVAPGERGLPNFDLVRVDRSGTAVIAGRAEPSAEVTVLANSEIVEKITAEADGSWVIYTETPLDAGPVELTLLMRTTDGRVVEGTETVVIYVPERPGDKPLIVRTTPGGASVVLQNPSDPDVSLGPLAIETIDYDDQGNVIFGGRASKGATVQIFANRNFIGQAVADENGRWEITGNVEPGRYTLQVIQLDEFGEPEFALEVPFERASFGDIELRDGAVIVQPGNSLWRISRKVYGEGAQYTIIYEANRDQIRDPDLIYPGQIFDLPEDEEEDE